MPRVPLLVIITSLCTLPLSAQTTDYRAAVAAAQPGRYDAAACGIKSGHFKVGSGQTYLSTAIRNEANRHRLLADAQRVLTEAIVQNGQTENPAAWYYLGRVYLYQGDVIGADTALARAERLAPECQGEIQGFRRTTGQALLEPAGLLLQAEKSDSALLVYRLSATINPANANTLMGVANLFEVAEQQDSALVYFRRAAMAGGSERAGIMARQRLGSLFAVSGPPDSAAVYYGELIRIADSTGDTDLRNGTTKNLASVYYNAQRYQEAIPLLRRYVGWRPDDSPARQYLASAYRQVGQVDSADALLRSQPATAAGGPDTTSANYFINRGASHYQANQHDKAAEDFAAAVQREPTNRLALRNLAATYYTLKNAAKLAEVAGQIVALEPLSETARRLQIQGYIWLDDRPRLERLSDELDAMRVKVEDVKFQPSGTGATLSATATGRSAKTSSGAVAPAPVTVVFEFLDQAGKVVTTVEHVVPALQPGLPAPIGVTASGTGIVDWRYKTK